MPGMQFEAGFAEENDGAKGKKKKKKKKKVSKKDDTEYADNDEE
jgi:hypothetical protein